MYRLLSLKMVRLLLAISVSLWMAGGGCFLVCSNFTKAAEMPFPAGQSEQTIVAGESCNGARSHACCARQSPEKAAESGSTSLEATVTLAALPSGTMKECPLALNATAVTVTSKQSDNAPGSGDATVGSVPRAQNKTVQAPARIPALQLANRGPTYLRCCVFLI